MSCGCAEHKVSVSRGQHVVRHRLSTEITAHENLRVHAQRCVDTVPQYIKLGSTINKFLNSEKKCTEKKTRNYWSCYKYVEILFFATQRGVSIGLC